MKDQLTISVVGCGWLGLPLAEALIINGYRIKGSTTSSEKIDLLRSKGIDPYLVHFNSVSNVEASQLLDCDILIINIPPGSRTADGPANYRRMADFFTKIIPTTRINKIILLSSTSVYSESNDTVCESDRPEPDTPGGNLLLEVEDQFLSIPDKKVIVLRASGLIGPQRHPSRFFKNKTGIPNGLAPVNLIHRDDVIGIILSLIADQHAAGIYNACSVEHPSKQDFYGLAAKVTKNAIPQFVSEKLSWKIISSIRVSQELNYSFIYPDLSNWLKDDKS